VGAGETDLAEGEVADGGEGARHPRVPFWEGTAGGGDEGAMDAGNDAACSIKSWVAGCVVAEAKVDVRIIVGTITREGGHAGKAEFERRAALLAVDPEPEEGMRGAAVHSVFGPGFIIKPVAEPGDLELEVGLIGADCGNNFSAGSTRAERCGNVQASI